MNISFESTARNDDGIGQDGCQVTLSIFEKHGRPYGRYVDEWLNDRDYNAAHTCILLNCTEVAPFLR